MYHNSWFHKLELFAGIYWTCISLCAFSTLWKCLLRVRSYVSVFQECLWTEHYIAAQGNNIFSLRGTFSSPLSQSIQGNCGKGKESDPTHRPTHHQHTTNASVDTLPTRRLTHYQHIGKMYYRQFFNKWDSKAIGCMSKNVTTVAILFCILLLYFLDLTAYYLLLPNLSLSYPFHSGVFGFL